MKKSLLIILFSICTLVANAQVFAVNGRQLSFAGTTNVQQVGALINGYYTVDTPTYTASPQIINPAPNSVIENKSFIGLSTPAILMYECTNITIRHCKFSKSIQQSISAENAKGLIIENCVFDSVGNGISVGNNISNPFNGGVSSGVTIQHNYFKNIIGGFPGSHAIMYGTNGGGNKINYNTFESIPHQSHCDDLVNINSSHSPSTDSLQIIGNWFRGGDWSTINQTGGAITFGDGGGSYDHIKNNIMINIVGIGNAGATNCVVENNTIYQSQAKAGADCCAFVLYNFSSGGTEATCHDNSYLYNKAWTISKSGVDQSFLCLQAISGNCQVAMGLSTNVEDTSLTETIIPTQLSNIYHY